jgi:hypothetical protein
MPGVDPRQQYGSAMRGRPQQDTEAMFAGARGHISGAQERLREVDFDPSAPVMQTGAPSEPTISGIVNGFSAITHMPPQAAGMLASGAEAADVLRGIHSFGKSAYKTPGVLSGLRGGPKDTADRLATLSGSQPAYKAANTARGLSKGVAEFSGYGDGVYVPQTSIRPHEQEQWQRQRASANMRAAASSAPNAVMAMLGYGPQ